ncbi:hypothetical protein RLOC_00003727 [Lonchura striata]|uniref:Uncharacterized protein n=1 Tax=Lonchura striata TaxID=40157 RepID=A0A218VDG7_9PASE|nr:hypothetical protein RLOC_00003727 [Lonchura striata domestica]
MLFVKPAFFIPQCCFHHCAKKRLNSTF